MPSPLDVDAVRRQFPGLGRQVNGRPAVFLDGPAGSQVPQRVIDAVGRLPAHDATPTTAGRSPPAASRTPCSTSRTQAVADCSAPPTPDEIVFGPNMTTLTFALSRGRWRGPGSPATRSSSRGLDHDANVSPWVLAAARRRGDRAARRRRRRRLHARPGRLRRAAVAAHAAGGGRAARRTRSARSTRSREIAALAARRRGARVRRRGALRARTGRSTWPRWDCDFLACSAYKFFGPHVGVLWGRRDLLERLPAYKVPGRRPGDAVPDRWMTGTAGFEAIAGPGAAVDYLAAWVSSRPAAPRSPPPTRRSAETRPRSRRGFLDGLARLPAWRGVGDRRPARIGERVATFGLTHPHPAGRGGRVALGASRDCSSGRALLRGGTDREARAGPGGDGAESGSFITPPPPRWTACSTSWPRCKRDPAPRTGSAHAVGGVASSISRTASTTSSATFRCSREKNGAVTNALVTLAGLIVQNNSPSRWRPLSAGP